MIIMYDVMLLYSVFVVGTYIINNNYNNNTFWIGI